MKDLTYITIIIILSIVLGLNHISSGETLSRERTILKQEIRALEIEIEGLQNIFNALQDLENNLQKSLKNETNKLRRVKYERIAETIQQAD